MFLFPLTNESEHLDLECVWVQIVWWRASDWIWWTCLCGGWTMVTEKPLYLELSWHLIGEAWRSQTNSDCTIWGLWGRHVGVFGGVSVWLFNETWAFPLYKWTNQGGGDDWGGRGQRSWCQLPPISNHFRLSGWLGQRVETLGHSRPLL